MNKSGIFFLIFTIISAIFLTWLNSTWLSQKSLLFYKKDKKIDYYLSDFSILNTTESGEMRYLIKGQHLVHQQSNGSSKIVKPNIIARDVNNSTITITATEAQQFSKDGLIKLTGNVDLIKDGSVKEENFELLTSDLSYNPTSQELSTDAKLSFTSATGKLTGEGFSTKLDEQELRINKNVQATFNPAK